jgi:2-dehydropantoate 2-reductase
MVLTLQNGVDSADEVAAVVGESHVLGGTTYVATALESPGVIVQTGVHRSIIFGEVFTDRGHLTPRVERLAEVLQAADIHVTAVADGRVPIWDKFVYLVAFSGFTGAARLSIGHLWQSSQARDVFYATSREVAAIAAAEGVTISANRYDTLREYIEVEALQGAAIRRAQAHGIATPMISTLYAVLKPWESGDPRH